MFIGTKNYKYIVSVPILLNIYDFYKHNTNFGQAPNLAREPQVGKHWVQYSTYSYPFHSLELDYLYECTDNQFKGENAETSIK